MPRAVPVKKGSSPQRLVRLSAATACALLLTACGPGEAESGTDGTDMDAAVEGERQEFDFTGTVQAIDTVTKIVSVANDEVPGWMMAMTMNFYVEPAEVLETLEPGDRITATVYSGDFQHLYEVEVVQQP